MKDLRDKVAVVTGGGGGIGRAIGEAMLAEGMKVVLADIVEDQLGEIVSEIGSDDVIGVQTDVASFESVCDLRDAAIERFGSVHVICNNAAVGAGAKGSVWEHHLNDWKWSLDVNVLGVINGMNAFIPTLIEQDVIQEAVGSQDQVWAAYGGFNRINFHTNNTHDVSPIILNAERHKEIQSSFMLFFSGFSRYATEIAEKQIANFDKRKQQLRGISAICDEAMGVLQSSSDPVRQLGELLHEGWMLKRELADGVATTDIDEMYAAGLEAGAIGGKLLGAGGGGFMLFMVDPDKQQQVRERLKDLIHVSFNFDSGGSKIVVFEPDDHINGQY